MSTMIEIPITLEFTLSIDPLEGISPEQIKQVLEYQLDQNYEAPFHVEMFKRGLFECVSRAISNSIEEREQDKYDGVVINIQNGQIAKWIKTSQRVFRRVKWWLSCMHVAGTKQ